MRVNSAMRAMGFMAAGLLLAACAAPQGGAPSNPVSDEALYRITYLRIYRQP